MTVKHLHYFFNSFHQGHYETRELLKKSMFSEFFDGLYDFTATLFDHWPLDSSFRLVLETWLSYIQPWRYKDPNAASEESGTFTPGQWDQFIRENIRFYDDLLAKVIQGRFFRQELSSSKSSYMLFRIAKVYGQDHLADCVRAIALTCKNNPSVMGTPVRSGGGGLQRQHHHQHEETFSAFDPKFKSALNELLLKINEGQFVLKAKKEKMTRRKTRLDANRQESTLRRIFAWLTESVDEQEIAELNEIDKTLQYLEESQVRIFSKCRRTSLTSVLVV